MPNKHKPRRNKVANLLVTKQDVIQSNIVYEDDRENIVDRMTADATDEVKAILDERFQSAKEATEVLSDKMAKWDLQYDAKWQDDSNDAEEKIFIPKTKEQLKVISAYIQLLVSQLKPLVTFQPMATSVLASTEEYKRAKLAEALVNFHLDDMWNFRNDIFPKWVKHFLKYTIGVLKVTYRDDDFLPDLNIEVVDRALLYIDPLTEFDIKNARWVMEKYYLTKSEVYERIEQGHWSLADDKMSMIQNWSDRPNEGILKRWYGDNFESASSVEEDDLVEIVDYWQSPKSGLDDVYAVMLGGINGELVRYGRNPFPYKGLPYRGKSFDPSDRPDGTGFVEEFRPFQEIYNNLYNLRLTDVRQNIIQPVATHGEFIDDQTMEDFANGQKYVRLSETALQKAQEDPGFDIRKHFAALPVHTSTEQLLTMDLPFVIGQGKEASNISDVFRGQNPQPGATLGQIQEQLQRNQGVFRPIYSQVMRMVEEVAEICLEYFKDPEFFPTNRIIQIIGKNRYAETIKDFHSPGGNIHVREVSPDEMDVDVTINAVNQADALASRTMLASALDPIFQGLGQIPGLAEKLMEELDFTQIFEMVLNTSGLDIDAIRLSDEEKKQKAMVRQQQQQQAMAMQQQQQQMALQMQQALEQIKAQAKIMEEQAKASAKAQTQIAIDRSKSQNELQLQTKRIDQEHEANLEEIITRILEEKSADLIKMNLEAQLERQANGSNSENQVSVGHGNNVNK